MLNLFSLLSLSKENYWKCKNFRCFFSTLPIPPPLFWDEISSSTLPSSNRSSLPRWLSILSFCLEINFWILDTLLEISYLQGWHQAQRTGRLNGFLITMQPSYLRARSKSVWIQVSLILIFSLVNGEEGLNLARTITL